MRYVTVTLMTLVEQSSNRSRIVAVMPHKTLSPVSDPIRPARRTWSYRATFGGVARRVVSPEQTCMGLVLFHAGTVGAPTLWGVVIRQTSK